MCVQERCVVGELWADCNPSKTKIFLLHEEQSWPSCQRPTVKDNASSSSRLNKLCKRESHLEVAEGADVELSLPWPPLRSPTWNHVADGGGEGGCWMQRSTPSHLSICISRRQHSGTSGGTKITAFSKQDLLGDFSPLCAFKVRERSCREPLCLFMYWYGNTRKQYRAFFNNAVLLGSAFPPSLWRHIEQWCMFTITKFSRHDFYYSFVQKVPFCINTRVRNMFVFIFMTIIIRLTLISFMDCNINDK